MVIIMNEMDAWQVFFQSGRIHDYLAYKCIHDNQFTDELSEKENEDYNNGTDNKTTEYR